MANGWAEEVWLLQGGRQTKKSYMSKGYNYGKIPKKHKDFFNSGIYWVFTYAFIEQLSPVALFIG